VRTRRAILLSVALLAPSPGRASPDEPGSGPVVYHIDPRVDAPVMIASALVIVIPALYSSRLIHPSCPCDPQAVNSFDRGAIGNHDDVADAVSSVTVGLMLAAPPVADWALLGPGKALTSDLVVYGEVLLVNGALVQIAKYAVQRPLPLTYAGDPELIQSPGGYRSFYSGHTATVVAALATAAYTIRRRYGEQVWPWLVVAGVGASVGVERVASGRHFPTDVIAGAAAGLAVGLTLPWLHASGPSLAAGPGGFGLSVSGRF